MYFYTYKITNLLNGKIYVGVHKTSDLNDDYMGSGKHLKNSQNKYGIENFKKEILMFHESENEMFEIEELIVDHEFVKRNDTYNLKLGGSGGNPGLIGAFSGKHHSDETKEKLRNLNKGLKHSDETKQKMSDSNWSKREPEKFKLHMSKIGKMKKSDETKAKISASLKLNKTNHNLGIIRNKETCPHCGKKGAKNTMVRWHFDNCKYITSNSSAG